jgi:uncharacterized protein YdeI (YjbR/CyaY-like superfamily)
MKPKFFSTPAAFRNWLEKNHDKKSELIVGFYKVNSGRKSITWQQSVDEALCFGWIDSIRKSLDQRRYTIRFTPRKHGSIWSAVNLGRVNELKLEGRMHSAGIAAFEKRKCHRSSVYSFEQKNIRLPDELSKRFSENKKAWNLFQSMAPSYQRAAIWWVISAKQQATQVRRLGELIRDSTEGRRIKQLRQPQKKN